MANVLPISITRPLRNKVCIFPEKEVCNLTSSDINAVLRRNPYSYYNLFYKPYIKRLDGDKKYNAIKRQYQKFKRKNIIENDENAGYYIYNIIDNNGQEFTGIVGKIPFADIKIGHVQQIEKSPVKLVNTQYELFERTGFISKPVNVVYDEIPTINSIIEKYKSRIPLFEFTKPNGCIHEVWQVLDNDDIEAIQKNFKKFTMPMLLLDNKSEFDGLHQLYLEKIKEKHHSGDEAYNYFPAFLIAKNQTNVFEYKKGIPYESKIKIEDLINALKNDFNIEEIEAAEEVEQGTILLYGINNKYKLTLKKQVDNHLPDSLIFDKYVIPHLIKFDNTCLPDSMKFCSGNRSLKCVENQLNKKNCKFGFIFAPASYEQLEYIAKNNFKMPANSTYLEPRLLKGLFIYEF